MNLSANVTYYIAVVGSGSGSLEMRRVFPATNDDFDDAIVAPGLPFTNNVDTREAMIDLSDPVSTCSDAFPTHSVWYAFTAPRNMRIEANTFGSSYLNAISVYQGASRMFVACDNGSSVYTPGAQVIFPATAGTTYYFLVADYLYSDGGDLVFNLPLVNSLEVRTSARTINYGQSVRVTAHLEAFEDTDNLEVSIFETLYGGTKTLVATGLVGDTGDFAVTVRPRKRTTFTAEWAGDGDYPALVSLPALVQVRVIARLVLKRFYSVSGIYKLYHAGVNPLMIGSVTPNHAGKRLTFIIQPKVNGRWQEAYERSFVLGPYSKVGVVLIRPPRGLIFRARTRFPRDVDHLGDYSPWVYFKIT